MKKWLLIGLLVWGFTSCIPTKHLQENEYLLYSTNIKGNKNISTETLEEFVRQKENHKFALLPVMPYLWTYYVGKNAYDSVRISKKFDKKLAKLQKKITKDSTSRRFSKLKKKYVKTVEKKQVTLKEGTWLMRTVGEPPVLFDSAKTYATANQIKKYYFSKGFFNAVITPHHVKKKKTVKLVYRVEENKPYSIHNVHYIFVDKKIEQIVSNRKLKNPYIQKNKNYDVYNIDLERESIYSTLKNNGYFEFKKQYILFEVDSTIGKNKVDITIKINNQLNEKEHEKLYLNEVIYTIDAGTIPPSGITERDTVVFNNIKMLQFEQLFSKRILNKKIKIHKNEEYSLEKTILTQKNLADLEMFKFVNINYFKIKDSLQALITTSPLEKYQFTTEMGVNVLQGLPGPFGNLNFRTRNLLYASEVIDINVRGGIEGQASAIDPNLVYRSTEIGGNVNLTYSHFILPFRISSLLSDNNPKTRYSYGYSFIQRPEFTRENMNGSINFLWRKKQFTQYTVTPIEISIIDTKEKSTAFDNYLNELKSKGNNLYQSFRPSIVSSMSFSYVYNNNKIGEKKKSNYLRFLAESGGTLLSLFKEDVLENEQKIAGLDYFRYLKTMVDVRFYQPLSAKNLFAYRLSVGAAKPLGKSNALPYEKYFFSGGSYSNRAWLPRRLGPGAYMPLNSDGSFDTKYRFEQPGEMMLEANAELRFNIFGFVDGAVFADAGNVWLFEVNESKPGASFSSSTFLSEIALGTGLGLRFDFSFIILRTDLGIKTWDPALDDGQRFVYKGLTWNEFKQNRRLSVLNIGIGYPF